MKPLRDSTDAEWLAALLWQARELTKVARRDYRGDRSNANRQRYVAASSRQGNALKAVLRLGRRIAEQEAQK